ncbi:hypothetical protein HHI36_000932 [Cryptolaemus montrouzieri]|uniref:Uncharacterized protein n=1 Tax=Cryptolaemus montrouzieri TaxID=559131 RepID=A0ABD2P674_9CUCU
MEKRRKLWSEVKYKTVAYAELNKTIKKMIREDLWKHQEEVEKILKRNNIITASKNKDGKEERDIEKVTHITEEFYKDLLYTSEKKPSDESRENITREIKNVNSEEFPK